MKKVIYFSMIIGLVGSVLFAAPQDKKTQKAKEEERLKNNFRTADLNNDGKLTVVELNKSTAFKKYATDKALFEKTDTDGDRALTIDELKGKKKRRSSGSSSTSSKDKTTSKTKKTTGK